MFFINDSSCKLVMSFYCLNNWEVKLKTIIFATTKKTFKTINKAFYIVAFLSDIMYFLPPVPLLKFNHSCLCENFLDLKNWIGKNGISVIFRNFRLVY